MASRCKKLYHWCISRAYCMSKWWSLLKRTSWSNKYKHVWLTTCLNFPACKIAGLAQATQNQPFFTGPFPAKFTPKISQNRPFFPRICLWKYRKIWLFFRDLSETLNRKLHCNLASQNLSLSRENGFLACAFVRAVTRGTYMYYLTGRVVSKVGQ